jgi:hypothetical protein
LKVRKKPKRRSRASVRGKGPGSPSSSSTGAPSQKPTAREQPQHNQESGAGREDAFANLQRGGALLFLVVRVGVCLWRHLPEPVREVVRGALS